ncbi:hypothetical protein [Pleionea sediminis]|uniref:hypothetical protein n=1 Tax=Pleionea sediminis TaxID=2569479 RepID=UPI0011868BE3|nr:hypothetical protein [Pleionea sediminis]
MKNVSAGLIFLFALGGINTNADADVMIKGESTISSSTITKTNISVHTDNGKEGDLAFMLQLDNNENLFISAKAQHSQFFTKQFSQQDFSLSLDVNDIAHFTTDNKVFSGDSCHGYLQSERGQIQLSLNDCKLLEKNMTEGKSAENTQIISLNTEVDRNTINHSSLPFPKSTGDMTKSLDQADCDLAVYYTVKAAHLYNQILATQQQWWNPSAPFILAALWIQWNEAVVLAEFHRQRC